MKISLLKPQNSMNFGSKKSKKDFLGNNNFWIALISLMIFLFTLIKWYPNLISGIKLKENIYTPIIALVLLASLFSLINSIKQLKKENEQ